MDMDAFQFHENVSRYSFEYNKAKVSRYYLDADTLNIEWTWLIQLLSV